MDEGKTITEDSHPGLDSMWKSSVQGKSDSRSDEPLEWETGTAAGITARRKWLTKKENREELIVDKDWTLGCEFGNGLIGTPSVLPVNFPARVALSCSYPYDRVVDFKTLHVVLPHPFPLRIPLLKYWDGQPAIYICKSRDGKKIFWSMAIQIEAVDDTDYAKAEEEDVVKENDEVKGKVDEAQVKGKTESVEQNGNGQEATSDDVD